MKLQQVICTKRGCGDHASGGYIHSEMSRDCNFSLIAMAQFTNREVKLQQVICTKRGCGDHLGDTYIVK